MKIHRHQSNQAFTMVEIALCLAVIGFGLVAIIGILPSGMQVQRENKEETIINQDGTYFLEAIRSGATNLDHLVHYITNITFVETNITQVNTTRETSYPCYYETGKRIIGSLSRPVGTIGVNVNCTLPDPPWELVRVKARVRSLSGSAVEKGSLPQAPADPTITFEYQFEAQVFPVGPFEPAATNQNPLLFQNLDRNLHEVRLTFRWPLLPGGKVGSNKKVFRTMISGLITNGAEGYFFTPNIYRHVSLP